jgi:mannosyltransferase
MAIRQQQLVIRRRLKPMLGLFALTLVGFLVRLVEIERWPLWGDEALTLMIGQWPVKILFLVPVDPTPGLYYALHKLFVGPMAGVAAARSISLVCGALLVPAAYLLAREARVPALLSAALVALSFPLIDYSQEARAYSLLVLLVTISAAFFVRWSKTRGPAALFGTLITCLLAFYTHFASVFWIGPAVLALLWLGRRRLVAPLLLTAILAVPELLRIFRYPSEGFIWLAQATPIQAADTLAKALLPFRPAAAWLLVAIPVVGWRGWIHRSRIDAWARANPGAAVAIAILAAVPLLAWLFGLVARPIFMTRTILIGVPGIILAIALLLKFEQRIARFFVVALYALSLLVTGTTRPKEDWRRVAEQVGNDAVLVCEPWQVTAVRHAAGDRNRLFLKRDDGLAEVSGMPWQRADFAIMSNRQRMAAALQRGRAAPPSLYPVWPVRSGTIATGATAPVTLGQAIALCERDQASRQPRYIAD